MYEVSKFQITVFIISVVLQIENICNTKIAFFNVSDCDIIQILIIHLCLGHTLLLVLDYQQFYLINRSFYDGRKINSYCIQRRGFH